MNEATKATALELQRGTRRVLNEAMYGSPVHITRYGRVEAVLVSLAWYERATAAIARLDATESRG